jgi:hypothetical protein
MEVLDIVWRAHACIYVALVAWVLKEEIGKAVIAVGTVVLGFVVMPYIALMVLWDILSARTRH